VAKGEVMAKKKKGKKKKIVRSPSPKTKMKKK
jgi:hypothetical protein